MNHRFVLVAVGVAGLSACAMAPAQESAGGNRMLIGTASTRTVQVSVVNSRVAVGEEPVYIFDKIDKVVIVWRLEGNRYKFDPVDGIRIMADGSGPAPANLRCGIVLVETLFGCVYDLPASGTTYKYSVQVVDWSVRPPRKLPLLDPRIVNDY